MLNTEYDCLLRFVRCVLKDDGGINEGAFLRLRQLADVMHECRDHAERSHEIEDIIERVSTIDGRYYLPEWNRRT